MKVDKINGCDAENVKVFSSNHTKHEIVIRSSGKPFDETSCTFRAEFTKKELEKICDFITINFKNDGSK